MPFLFTNPDRLLAQYCRTGEPQTLGELFDRTAPELLRVAAWLCGNRTDAEDLLQRTFVTVLHSRTTYDPQRRALPWLCGILGNHAKKLQEQRARPAPVLLPNAAPDPVRAAADAEFAAAVARVRSQLGSPYAEVLDLHLAEGLDANAIALRLQRPAGTVRTQIVRGLALLRRHLPNGFVSGLLLSASAQAASLAVVRANVLAQAAGGVTTAAAGAAMTFGGIVMGKKSLWSVAGLLVLLGGGAWLWQQQDANGVARAEAAVVATAVPSAMEGPGSAASVTPPASSDRVAATIADLPAPDPEFATLVVRMHWADDGSPAESVGVRAWPDPFHPLQVREAVTDAKGTAIVRRIPPGNCWLDIAFADVPQVELLAGSVRVLDVAAQRDGFVEGRVIDDGGRPIASARLWLSTYGNPNKGHEVGLTDAVGRFRLPFKEGHYLGARKAGHAPSRLRSPSKTLRVFDLCLPAGGGSMRGRVVDADNRPIAGALVRIGDLGGGVIPGGSLEENQTLPDAPQVITDARGEFVHEGLLAKSTTVRAWATGHGPATADVPVVAGQWANVQLVLPRAGTVEGTVRNEAGTPVGAATITTPGGYETFGRAYTVTDAQGHYRLEHVSLGLQKLIARGKAGDARTELTITTDRVERWDPILTIEGRVRGVLLGPDGQALASMYVVPVGERGYADPRRRSTTDAEGKFELRGVTTPRAHLVVGLGDIRLAKRKDVATDSQPIVITLSEAEFPSAHVQGRVVDSDGKPAAAVLVGVTHTRWGGTGIKTNTDGTFDRGPLPAGEYRVDVEATGSGRLSIGTVSVQPGQRLQLPDIVLLRSGRVEIDLRDSEQASCFLFIHRRDGHSIASLDSEGRTLSYTLPPGDYLAVTQGGTTCGRVTFTIRTGETTKVVMPFAATRSVSFEGLAAAEANGSILVHDVNAALVDVLYWEVVDGTNPARFVRTGNLPAGTYRAELKTRDGRTTNTPFTVPAQGDVPTVHIDLAPR